MAAAISAKEAGASHVLIIERDRELGGILQQCIHNGFGLHRFDQELTGPGYAHRYIELVKAAGIDVWLDTTVLSADPGGIVTSVNPEAGLRVVTCASVVYAMGCRERTRGAIRIPGSRPAGVFTAGAAQRMVNMEGYLPGRNVVIVGSGDIGLIMARRMTLEGATVKGVFEIMPYSNGLNRNIVQCLEDYDIPLYLSHSVVAVHGEDRVTGVTVARVDEKMTPVPGTEFDVECDCVLLSVGLIPENELGRAHALEIDPVTGGAVVDQFRRTNLAGTFAAGNVLQVHDLVDWVSQEAEIAGRSAALHALGKLPEVRDFANRHRRRRDPIRRAAEIVAACGRVFRALLHARPAAARRIHAAPSHGRPRRLGALLRGRQAERDDRRRRSLGKDRAGPKDHVHGGARAGGRRARGQAGRRGNRMTRRAQSVLCIGCPTGCSGEVLIEDGVVVEMHGYTCKRGRAYVAEEVTAPKRMVTTTVRVNGGALALLPVVSDRPVPKEQIFACLAQLRKVAVSAPVTTDSVVVADILGLGVNFVAARDCPSFGSPAWSGAEDGAPAPRNEAKEPEPIDGAQIFEKQLDLLRNRLRTDPKSLRQVFIDDGTRAIAWEFHQDQLGAAFTRTLWNLLLRSDDMSLILQRFISALPLRLKQKFIAALDARLSDRYPMFDGRSKDWPAESLIPAYVHPADVRANGFDLTTMGHIGYRALGYTAREVDLFAWLETLRNTQRDHGLSEVGPASPGPDDTQARLPGQYPHPGHAEPARARQA